MRMEASWVRLVPLWGTGVCSCCLFSAMWRNKKTAIWKPTRVPSPDTGSASTLILISQPLELWEKDFYCLSQRKKRKESWNTKHLGEECSWWDLGSLQIKLQSLPLPMFPSWHWSRFKFIMQMYLIFTCTFFLSSLDARCFAQCLTQIRH